MLETTRTYRAKIVNHDRIARDLDACGFAASKLWNVARYYAQDRWETSGEIPGDAEIKRELKKAERYNDLHSQSSQRVLEELVEAFSSWFESRKRVPAANPPGYRKRGDAHPRSTVTWKQKGIKHQPDENRIRLSKGSNLKRNRGDFIWIRYETLPDARLDDLQQVRAVWIGDRWEVHLVSRVEIQVDPPTDAKTAGIDLGISNYLALAFEDDVVELYPGNVLKEDKHYFTRKEYETQGTNGPSRRGLQLRTKLARRKSHFLHALSKRIVNRCVEEGVSHIAIGDLSSVKRKEDGEPVDWGRHANKKLYGWEPCRFTQMLEYKAEAAGIILERVDEWGTSVTCSSCWCRNPANRVERGLYACDSCDLVCNADVNAAMNLKNAITRNPTRDTGNGRLARPAVFLFDRTTGRFFPQSGDCEPS